MHQSLCLLCFSSEKWCDVSVVSQDMFLKCDDSVDGVVDGDDSGDGVGIDGGDGEDADTVCEDTVGECAVGVSGINEDSVGEDGVDGIVVGGGNVCL